jgi:CPA2 family monovalent cation:H+ antiporter-2
VIAYLPAKAMIVILMGATMRWPAPVIVRAAIAGAVEPELGQLALVATMALALVLIQRNAWFATLLGGASHHFKAIAEEEAIANKVND